MTFPRDQSELDIPMTTLKKTKLVKGRGGGAPWYHSLGETLNRVTLCGSHLPIIKATLWVPTCIQLYNGHL